MLSADALLACTAHYNGSRPTGHLDDRGVMSSAREGCRSNGGSSRIADTRATSGNSRPLLCTDGRLSASSDRFRLVAVGRGRPDEHQVSSQQQTFGPQSHSILARRAAPPDSTFGRPTGRVRDSTQSSCPAPINQRLRSSWRPADQLLTAAVRPLWASCPPRV